MSRTEQGLSSFDPLKIYRFIAHLRGVVARLSLTRPITIGGESADTMRDLDDYATALSFHAYEPDVSRLGTVLREASLFASRRHKSVLLSETLSTLFLHATSDSDDQTQLRLYRSTLPAIESAGIGYFAVALMEGRFPFSWVGMFRPDGSRKPVADYVESVWRSANRMRHRG